MGAVAQRHGARRRSAPTARASSIFSDYARPAIRLAAIMEIPVIYVFTHDSIGVGEDGPTHQPIEQLASLRAIPGLIVLRPGDANEVVEAWRVIAETPPRAGGARAVAPGDADARPHASTRPPRACARAPTSSPTRRRQAGGDPDRHRQRGRRCASRRTSSSTPRASRRASSACRRGSCSRSRPQAYRDARAAAGGDGARRRRAGVDLRLGALRRPHRRR